MMNSKPTLLKTYNKELIITDSIITYLFHCKKNKNITYKIENKNKFKDSSRIHLNPVDRNRFS